MKKEMPAFLMKGKEDKMKGKKPPAAKKAAAKKMPPKKGGYAMGGKVKSSC